MPVQIESHDKEVYAAQRIDGIVALVDTAGGLLPDTYMAANLVLYAVPQVILANAEVMAELSPEQQDALRTAATELHDEQLADESRAESSAARCAMGAVVFLASDEDIQAIESATQPVRESLASDAATAGFIDRIEALKAETPAAALPKTCGTTPATTALHTESLGSDTIPDGTYRAAGTRQDSLRTGWESDCDLQLGDEHIVMVIDGDGESYTLLLACGDETFSVGDSGPLEYVDGTVLMRSTGGGPSYAIFGWAVEDAVLTLELVDTIDDFAPASVLRFLFERDFVRDVS